MKVGIVGHGHVGKAQKTLFNEAVVFDTGQEIGSAEEINRCDVAFVCVPTPMLDDGSCDASMVESVVAWLETPLICIMSTVAPGTTERLRRESGKSIVFQPEYAGETVDHPLADKSARSFLILGGEREDTDLVVEVYKHVYNSSIRIMQTDSTTAEVIKYMENSFIGTYVVFSNEFYNICEALGVSYNEVREGFLLDPRMTPFWTFVFPEKRGFEGKCIPKDMNAIVDASAKRGYLPRFLRSVLENNTRLRDDQE